jgi:peptide/nickel transport system ATP-binding protein
VVVQRQILETLVRLQRKQRNSLVIVSHDLGVHYQVAHRVAILYAGRLVEVGLTDDVLGRPAHPYTQGLVDALPRLGDRTQRQGIEGRPPDLLELPPGCRFAPRCPLRFDRCDSIDPGLYPVGPSGRGAACLLQEAAP